MVVETVVGAVLLLHLPCPAQDAEEVAGCVFTDRTPPAVYVLPHLYPRLHRFTVRHELGHIACGGPGGTDTERCADDWARAHPGRVILK